MSYIEMFYKVLFVENVILAMACEEIRKSPCAEVAIPYRDPDGKIYGMTCYLGQVPHNTPAVLEMLTLKEYARLLARCGKSDEQYENVAAAYQYGAKPEDKTQCLVEFSRPQDFATRGMDGSCPKWEWRLINCIVTGDYQDDKFTLRKGTSYIVNAWADIRMTDQQWFSLFTSVFPMMSMRTYGPPPPMRPTDCLREDDFWHNSLGKPPADCPDDDDYGY